MRWITFAIAAYLFVSTQFALGGLLGWGEATPNLVLVLVVFVALHAQPRPALAAAFVAGLMHDVIAGHGLGTYALGYPLAVAAASPLRDVMSADHAATHALVTFALGVLLAIYLDVRHVVRARLVPDDPSIAIGARLLGATATAALAIPVLWALRGARNAFAFWRR